MFKIYRRYRILVHLLVWTVYFASTILPSVISTNSLEIKAYFLTHFIVLVISTYTNTIFLVRAYLEKERYREYVVGLLLLVLLSLLAIYLSGIVFNYPGNEAKFVNYNIRAMLGFLMEFSLLAMFKAAKVWYIRSKRLKELEFQKIQAELNLLRGQLDAHFIFNTLNNLYLLVLNKSDKALDALLKLSELLSYTIYESHEKRVSIGRELEFINNYIGLQQLRLDASQVVCFETELDDDVLIEPLILFNFIENAFKFADGNITVEGAKYHVYITIKVKQGTLTMTVLNGKSDTQTTERNSGVGLSNAVKRLELAYKDLHVLDIQNHDNSYRVQLTIYEL